jgi:GNAT superfamily N-acetyltransferase
MDLVVTDGHRLVVAQQIQRSVRAKVPNRIDVTRADVGRSGMTSSPAADAVVQRERDLLDPIHRGDPMALDDLLHPDFLEFGGSGTVWTREAIVEELLGDPKIGPLELVDTNVAFLDADTALLTYRLLIDGRPSVRSSVWVLDGGRWRIRFHQGTPVQATVPVVPEPDVLDPALVVEWRGGFGDDEVNALHAEAFETRVFTSAEWPWRTLVARHSLGWVVARRAGRLVGFVNVIWDGSAHAWLQDVMVAADERHRGIGEQVVDLARDRAAAAGCEWLHVDFDDDLAAFYLDRCGFRRTSAGLIALGR